jgi:hypothetical protein
MADIGPQRLSLAFYLCPFSEAISLLLIFFLNLIFFFLNTQKTLIFRIALKDGRISGSVLQQSSSSSFGFSTVLKEGPSTS